LKYSAGDSFRTSASAMVLPYTGAALAPGEGASSVPQEFLGENGQIIIRNGTDVLPFMPIP
jgi:hypothetical protein